MKRANELDDFDYEGFWNYIEQNYTVDSFGRSVLSNAIDYGLKHLNSNLNQFAYYLSDIVNDMTFGEAAQFCPDDWLTDAIW